MNATFRPERAWWILRATVVLPEAVPPAMPTTSGGVMRAARLARDRLERQHLGVLLVRVLAEEPPRPRGEALGELGREHEGGERFACRREELPGFGPPAVQSFGEHF